MGNAPFIPLELFAAAFELELAVEAVPVVVVGAHAGLVHEADGGGTLIDGGGLRGVVVFALAPGAAAGHVAFEALLRTLGRAVEREEWAQEVLVDAVADVADDEGLLAAQRVLGEARARVEVARGVDAEHAARAAPVLVVAHGVERLADVFAEERAGIVLVPAAVDNLVGQQHELLLEAEVVALLPDILEHGVDVHLVDAEAVEVHDALADVGDVGAADGHLGAGIGELLEPERDVAHHIAVRAAVGGVDDAVLVGRGLLPYAVEVVLALGAVDGDADGEVVAVLLDEALHLGRVVVDAVGGEGEAVGVEPVVVQFEHAELEVVTDAVDELDFEEGLAADEVPDDALLAEVILASQHVVDEGLGGVPRHAFLDVLADQVAILAGQLAVLGDDERDVLGHALLPGF